MEFWINYFVLPVLIFLMRIADVSLGTIRIIFVSRGTRLLSAILGFFEVLIWLVAITQILRNLNNPVHYIAYAGGFGMGNYIGISIERYLSMGNRAVRVITKKDASELIAALKSNGYGITCVDGEGITGPVKLIYTVVKRNNVSKVINLVKEFNPKAFYTVEEIRYVQEDSVFPQQEIPSKPFERMFSFVNKKK